MNFWRAFLRGLASISLFPARLTMPIPKRGRTWREMSNYNPCSPLYGLTDKQIEDHFKLIDENFREIDEMRASLGKRIARPLKRR